MANSALILPRLLLRQNLTTFIYYIYSKAEKWVTLQNEKKVLKLNLYR